MANQARITVAQDQSGVVRVSVQSGIAGEMPLDAPASVNEYNTLGDLKNAIEEAMLNFTNQLPLLALAQKYRANNSNVTALLNVAKFSVIFDQDPDQFGIRFKQD